MEKIKILNRQIGKVGIVEIIGELSGKEPSDAASVMKEKLNHLDTRFGLFNLLGLYQFDRGSCQIILDEAGRFQKSALVGSHRLNRLLSRQTSPKEDAKIGVLPNMPSAIRYFQGELAAEPLTWAEAERRKFKRIPMALPVELELIPADGKKASAVLVSSNLSQAGLMAQFIDSESEQLLLPHLDPFELQMLGIRIFLPKDQVAVFKGKVIEWNREDHRIHLEFYESEELARDLYQEFLEGQKQNDDKKE